MEGGVLRLVLLLSLGQLTSLFLAISHFASSVIANQGVHTPLTQSFFSYSMLALFGGAIFLWRRQRLLVPWYCYLPLAFVDVQGNYLVVKAFQYSSITSIMLLDCWTIPWVIILTWFFLGTRYSIWQFLGSAICIMGLCLVLLSDSSSSRGGGERPVLGDILVIGGTFCYAISNVGEEYCVKKKSSVEFLMMLGLFGMLVALCEISLLEREAVESVKWTPTMMAIFAGFAAASGMFYVLMPFTLKMGGAALFNLSLLTSDMWAVAVRFFFYHQKVDWLYFIAFAVVVIGLVVYSLSKRKCHAGANLLEADKVFGIEYEALSEECPVGTVVDAFEEDIVVHGNSESHLEREVLPDIKCQNAMV